LSIKGIELIPFLSLTFDPAGHFALPNSKGNSADTSNSLVTNEVFDIIIIVGASLHSPEYR
jgi:hypothetical protein